MNLYCFHDLYHSNPSFLIHIQVPQIKFTILGNLTEAYPGVFWGGFSFGFVQFIVKEFMPPFLKGSEILFYRGRGNFIEQTGERWPLFVHESMESIGQIRVLIGKSSTALFV